MENLTGAVTADGDSPTGESQTSEQVAEGSTDQTGAAHVGTGASAAPVKPYDWYAPDTWGDRKPEDVLKEIQGHVTGLSETNKSRDTELQQEREQRRQLLREAEAVLKDEKLYALCRQKMGLNPSSIETMPAQKDAISNLPKVELTADMTVGEAQDRFNRALMERDKFHTDYTKQAVNEALTRFKEEVYKELGQSLAPMHKSKWKSAMENAVQSFGPAFMEVRGQLVNYIDGPYANQYTGENEGELIDKVFRAEFPEQYRKHILQTASQQQATTAKATTAPATRQVGTLPTDDSIESCIVRANARAEAALRAKGIV